MTLANDIKGLDGEPIRIESTPVKTTVLISEGADLNEIREIGFLENWENNSIHIPIRSEQRILLSDGETLKNPVLIIYSDADNINVDRPILDTTENRAILSAGLEKAGLDPDSWVFQTSPLIQSKEYNSDTLQRYVWIALFLLAAFIVASTHNVEIYASDRAKLLHLRYLHGVPFLRRYGSLWQRVAIPYAIVAGIALIFPELVNKIMSLQYEGVYLDSYKMDLTLRLVFMLFGTLLILDLLLHAGVIRRFQKKSVTRLKGER